MRRAVLIAVLGASFLAGAAVRHIAPRLIPPNQQAEISQAIGHDETTIYRTNFNNAARPIVCPRLPDQVILLIGQSNAANYGGERHRAGPNVSVYYDGQCYPAIDPLLGASGDRGSIWPLVGDSLAQGGRKIVLVPLAIGGSRMEEWMPGGRLNDRIRYAVEGLRAAGLAPTMSLIVQGETEGDQHLDRSQYQSDTTKLLVSLPGKVWMATTSRCWSEPNIAIRFAQGEARQAANALPGPDMDALPNSLRINGCHYNGSGMRRLAREWVAAINEVAR